MAGPRSLVRAAVRAAKGLPVRTPRFAGATLDEADERLAADLLASEDGWKDEAPVRDFEAGFAAWTGARDAATFLGGRTALAAALEALGLRAGDEVVVPGYTCVVVPNAVRHLGLAVRFVDVEPETYGLDAAALRNAIRPKTKAVVLHHLYGLVARDYEETAEAAREKGLRVVEDCAQASGALWKGKPVGQLGDVAVHSFEKTKVLTTVFGGAATTRDPELAARLRSIQAASPLPPEAATRQMLQGVPALRAGKREGTWISTTDDELRGAPPPLGRCRLPPPLARLGLQQLAKADRLNERRRHRARRWDDWAREEGLRPATVVEGSVPAFLRYPVRVPRAQKEDLSWGRRLGVRPGVWFVSQQHPSALPVPGCPAGAEAAATVVNLPTLW